MYSKALLDKPSQYIKSNLKEGAIFYLYLWNSCILINIVNYVGAKIAV